MIADRNFHALCFYSCRLSYGGTSLVMLSKFDVSDEFTLTICSMGLMLSSDNGSDELEPLPNLDQYLIFFAYQ